MDAEFVYKTLKNVNLTTSNATLVKLTAIMYLHKICNFGKSWDVTHSV